MVHYRTEECQGIIAAEVTPHTIKSIKASTCAFAVLKLVPSRKELPLEACLARRLEKRGALSLEASCQTYWWLASEKGANLFHSADTCINDTSRCDIGRRFARPRISLVSDESVSQNGYTGSQPV